MRAHFSALEKKENKDTTTRVCALYIFFWFCKKNKNMCGIFWARIPHSSEYGIDFEHIISLIKTESVRLLGHRGPDGAHSIEIECTTCHAITIMAHTRLAIVGKNQSSNSGRQPFLAKCQDGTTLALTANAEIYNHKALKSEAKFSNCAIVNDDDESDCYAILKAYQVLRDSDELETLCTYLDGPFAFVIEDAGDKVVIARDRLGINPLYILYIKTESTPNAGPAALNIIAAASEVKMLSRLVSILVESKVEWARNCVIDEFDPGTMVIFDHKKMHWHRYFEVRQLRPAVVSKFFSYKESCRIIRSALVAAVSKRISETGDCCDVPYGMFLSGGLDSTIVAYITAWLRAMHPAVSDANPRLPTFSIGLVGSPDLASAATIAADLGTDHHEVTFTVEEGIAALKDVIWHLETYDVTTIRAAVPMYLLCKYIRQTRPDIKVLLSGEGADELFGGYLYFHNAPSVAEFQREIYDKLHLLFKYDLLRANKSAAAHGLEVRVPFLDNDVLATVLSLVPMERKMPAAAATAALSQKKIEKLILRQSFDRDFCEDNTDQQPWVPPQFLYRQKEQFSDGVGYNWIDSIKRYAAEKVTQHDAELIKCITYNTPASPEAALYRSIFLELFPFEEAAHLVPPFAQQSVACSTHTAAKWMPLTLDPSGRSVTSVHNQPV